MLNMLIPQGEDNKRKNMSMAALLRSGGSPAGMMPPGIGGQIPPSVLEMLMSKFGGGMPGGMGGGSFGGGSGG